MFEKQSRAIAFAFHASISSIAKSSSGFIGHYIYIKTIDYFPGFVFLFFGTFSFIFSILGTYV